MHSRKNPLTQLSHRNLFQDEYGILELAANTTPTRTSKLPEIMRYFRLQLIQWANSILILIKQQWEKK